MTFHGRVLERACLFESHVYVEALTWTHTKHSVLCAHSSVRRDNIKTLVLYAVTVLREY